MRAERTIRRADLCVLVVDATGGVSAQDKKIAGLIQQSRKPSLVVLNKWDLVKPARGGRAAMEELITETRERLFFLDYAPVLVASAATGENVQRLFRFISGIKAAARERIGTGVLNRMMRAAMAETLPPTIGNKRLKLFYATQAAGDPERAIDPPEFVLFVNEPKLLSDPYARFIERKIREHQPYAGLPVLLTPRARTETRED
jgi:GTP-binding protein